jgi:hypothetical protein
MVLILSFMNIDQKLLNVFNFSRKLVKNSRDNLPVDGHKYLPVSRSTGHVQIRQVTYYRTLSACCLLMCIVINTAETEGAQLFIGPLAPENALQSRGS